jgi:antitoxin CptB
MTDEMDVRRRRALYRANHRGTKEMDVLLGRFAEARLPEMPDGGLERFERFLALPDPSLQSWILEPAGLSASELDESEFRDVVVEVRLFHGLDAKGMNKG